MSLMVGIGKGAENGFLIRSGEALQTAHQIKTVVLDKTGTITRGRPSVTDVVLGSSGLSEAEVLGLAAAAEKGSEHPLAEAMRPGGPGLRAGRALRLLRDHPRWAWRRASTCPRRR